MSLSISLGLGDSYREPAECIVEIDDEEIVDLYQYLKEVTVEMKRGQPTVCTLVFDSVRTETGDWSVQDDPLVAAWKKIKILAAFGSATEEVMRGYIKTVKAGYPENMGTTSVTVSGQDETIQLDREQVGESLSREDAPQNDGDIVRTLAQDTDLTVEAEDGLANTSLNQSSTKINFLYERAKANGYELYTREGTLYFAPPDLGGQPQAPIRVYAGSSTNCLNIAVNYDGHKPDRVRYTRASEDNGAGSETEELAPDLDVLGDALATSEGSGLSPFTWDLTSPNGATLEEVRARAQAAANENAWKVSAEGTLDGSLYGHVLLTEETVTVDGVGDSYGGTYYVDNVTHKFSSSGYQQDFKLLRNATGGEAAAAASNS